jgi:hypothetical protein
MQSYEYDNTVYKEEMESFHQLDDVYLDHLKSLGLDGEGDVIDLSDTESPDLVDFKDEGEDLVDLL